MPWTEVVFMNQPRIIVFCTSRQFCFKAARGANPSHDPPRPVADNFATMTACPCPGPDLFRAMPDPTLTLEDVHFAWPDGAPLFAGLDLVVQPGEKVFLGGASGSGKSTLLALIGGLVNPGRGRVTVAGVNLATLRRGAADRHRADHVGVIFQQFSLLPWLNPVANVSLGCRFSPRRRARVGNVDAAARGLLAAMDIDRALFNRPAAALSVGQQQRVAAARALIGAPDLVLADEPTSALDADRRDEFLELLFTACAGSGSAVLFVSHDRQLTGRFDRVLELETIARGVAA